MQNAQSILSHHSNSGQVDFKRLGGILAQWLTRLFGCWHTEMSRPFTQDKKTYRACLDCGARRDFDPARWEMVGDYYYGKPSTGELYRIEHSAQAQGRRAARIRLAA
jgi:hypothetical protein